MVHWDKQILYEFQARHHGTVERYIHKALCKHVVQTGRVPPPPGWMTPVKALRAEAVAAKSSEKIRQKLPESDAQCEVMGVPRPVDRPAVDGEPVAGRAVLLTTASTKTLGSGLSTGDPVRLWNADQVVDSFSYPFDPGNGVSAEKEAIEGRRRATSIL